MFWIHKLINTFKFLKYCLMDLFIERSNIEFTFLQKIFQDKCKICLFVFSIIVFIVTASIATSLGFYQDSSSLILVSLDGFRSNFLHRNITPNLDALAASGLYAVSLRPAFPSMTFPNHHTLVTGWFPGSHGIIANSFIHPLTGKKFDYHNDSSTENPEWWGGEPIWVTVERVLRRPTAVFAWPGANAHRPTFRIPYVQGVLVKERIDKIISWLSSAEPPAFMAVYIPDVDTSAHESGPDSELTIAAIKNVDKAIGDLILAISSLKSSRLKPNLVIVSDHGTMELSNDSPVVLLSNLLSESITKPIIKEDELNVKIENINNKESTIPITSVRVFSCNGPVLLIDSIDPIDRPSLILRLKNSCKKLHCDAYLRHEVPASFVYSEHDCIPEIVIIAHPGYVFSIDPNEKFGKGMHGYDPDSTNDMRAIFLANGPFFTGKRKGKIPPFHNIEVFSVLCKILGISSPPPNNGTKTISWLDD